MATSIENFMETATDEQRELLFDMTRWAEYEKKYSDEVNRICDSIKSGVYSSDGISITLCEDKDDAMIISAEPRRKLKKVRELMKENMKKAVELGMEHLGIIQRNYEHYVGKPLTTE